LASATAYAQSVDLTPSLAASQVYDDNVYFRPTDRVGAFFSRFDVALGTALRSERFRLEVRYGLRAEVYTPPNDALTSAAARHGGELEAAGKLSPELELSGGGAYSNSLNAGDAVLLAGGLDAGRVRTQTLTLHAGFGVRTGYRSEFHGEYRFSWLSQGDVTAPTHTEKLGASWALTRRDTLRLDAIGQQIDVGVAQVNAVTPMVGWDHLLGPRTTLALRAGPRIGSDGVDVEGSAGVVHDELPTRLELTYTRGFSAVPGRVEVFKTDSVLAKAQGALGDLTALTDVALFRSESPSLLAYAARVDAELQFPVAVWCRLFAAYRFAFQRLDPADPPNTFQHVVFAGVVVVTGETAALPRRPL
jgi:hypothetical protein